MDTFIVSARKYRPQNFSTVVGQAHITTTLKNAINNNQLAHAFLFTGPRGVGKTTCARILAKTINCENRSKEGEACNTCNSCTSFDNGTSLNIHELDAASNNSVDDIRNLVDQVRFAPQAGKYKVYIIDEVHMLSSAAFNAFLKTLEEPPHFAIFILATTEKHKILPTILSRCQIFDFKRITATDTVEHLQEICDKENIEAEKTALHVISQKSEGCMRDALSILDKIVSFSGGKLTYSQTLEHLNILDEDYFFRLIGHLQSEQLPEAMLLYDEINQKGFEGDTLLEGFAEFIRNLLVSKDPKAAKLLEVADDFKQKYVTYSAGISIGWLIAALNMLNEGLIQIKQTRNIKLLIEMILIKLAYLNQAVQMISSDTGISKKKVADNQKAMTFRSLPLVALKESIQSPSPVASKVTVKEEPKASLIIEKAEEKEPKKVHSPAVETRKPEPSSAIKKLHSLDAIRKEVTAEMALLNPALPLTEEALQNAWKQFVEKMQLEKMNPAAISNFNMAKLNVEGDNDFTIIVEGVLQQRFIESNKSPIIDFLQAFFNNRELKFKILMLEKKEEAEVKQKGLNTKEIYQKLISQNPHIKELRDKLNLELDY